jgi:crossover junction endodeoxyribonuclease RuvC
LPAFEPSAGRAPGGAGATRILGVDPGSLVTGYGIIDVEHGRARHVASGCIRTAGVEFPERLRRIFEGISAVVREHGPQELAIERVFMNNNADSALKLGQARGAALVAVVSISMPVFEFSATEVKQAIVGRGHAAKQQIQHMVKVLLSLPERPPADAADALAVALCHAHTRRAVLGRRLPGRRPSTRSAWR